ncbi:MAG: hypothetical protein WAV28_08205 [Sedimentisphaerales bacterium]
MLGLENEAGRFEKYCYYNLNRHHNLVEISYQKAHLPGKGILRFGLKPRIDSYAESMYVKLSEESLLVKLVLQGWNDRF